MNLRAHRRPVLAAAVVFHLIGGFVAVQTGVGSALVTSLFLVAVVAWGYGPLAGLVGATLLRVGALILWDALGGMDALFGLSPLSLVPAFVADVLIVAIMSALRRAELAQAAARDALRAKNAELAEALAEVKELRGMLPICAWCKSVRDVDGLWDKLETYLSKHSHATPTHGICPDCLAREEAAFRKDKGRVLAGGRSG